MADRVEQQSENAQSVKPVQRKQGITRRKLLIGIAGFALAEAAVGSNFAWNKFYHNFPHWFQSFWLARQGITELTYRYHTDSVLAIAWSPDGKHIASGSYDGTVQIWDPTVGSPIFVYHHRPVGSSFYGVYTTAWSPGGLRIASGGSDGIVDIWDAIFGSNIFGTNIITYNDNLNSQFGIAALTWSPNTKQLAFTDTFKIYILDSATGKKLLTYPKTSQQAAMSSFFLGSSTFSSDSKESKKSGYTALSLLNNPLQPLSAGSTGPIITVAWSQGGKYIASSYDKTVQVWNATTADTILTYSRHSGSVNAVAWSPDGKHIASGGNDQTVQVWDATTGKNLFTFNGHSDSVYAVAWSPHGKHIASGGNDQTVQVWDATTGKNLFTFNGHSDSVNAVAWSPNGKHIASGGNDQTVLIWKAPN